MTTEQPGIREYALLFTLATIWGSSFVFIKFAVMDVPAVTVTTVRISSAALFMLVVVRMAGQSFAFERGAWIAIFFAALTGNVLPFTLISWGQERIDSGLAAIFLATMPLTTLLLAHIFTADEKMTVRKTIGVSLGLVGLVILIGPQHLAELGGNTIRELAVVAAAICYGINALVTKQLVHLPRRAAVAATLVVSSVIMIPASLLIDQPWTLSPSTTTIVSMVLLGVLHTAIASLMMFAIISRQGATFFSQINFLIPVMGVFWGVVVFAERPSANALIALILILIGIAVVRGRTNRVTPPESA